MYLYGDNLIRDAPNTPEDIEESGKVVLRLTQDCLPGTQVLFDKFFASTVLLIKIKKLKLGATATFRVARTGNCSLKEEKGRIDFRTEKDSRDVICTCNDNRPVTVGLNVDSVEPLHTFTRYETKTYVNMERPNLVRAKNQSMGGVDKPDKLLFFYQNDLNTNKWYKRVLLHLIDLSVPNASRRICFLQTSNLRQHLD